MLRSEVKNQKPWKKLVIEINGAPTTKNGSGKIIKGALFCATVSLIIMFHIKLGPFLHKNITERHWIKTL